MKFGDNPVGRSSISSIFWYEIKTLVTNSKTLICISSFVKVISFYFYDLLNGSLFESIIGFRRTLYRTSSGHRTGGKSGRWYGNEVA